tara:strand:+ start:950 stop:1402 length:453 start_codon:yes stop_codon:yes gene_type:complete
MKIKVYSQSHCKYCDNIKKVLDENKVDYETIEIDDNRDEWNELTRIIGVGMTPTIKYGEEVWVPSRDFRSPEELIKRIEYIKEYPLPITTQDEKIEMILNATKNLAMSMNNLNLSLTNIHQKVNQLTTPTPTPIVKNETKEEVKEETTSN